MVIGLGALMPFMTRYGLLAQPKLPYARLTIGHAFTAFTIIEQIRRAAHDNAIDLRTTPIAICGAAGSTGSATARGLIELMRDQIGQLLLIDIRGERNEALAAELRAIAPEVKIQTSTDLHDMRTARLSVVVTNAPDAIITADHLAPDAIVLDDSQPRNTSPDLLAQRPDVRIYDVLARVPGLDVHFDWGLVRDDPSITFTCLAETIALAHVNRMELCTVGHVSGARVRQVGEVATAQGITPAPWTSFYVHTE